MSRARRKSRRQVDYPRYSSIMSEAVRNVCSGASHALVFLLAFVALIGAVSVVQMLTVSQFIDNAREFKDSGANIQIVGNREGISGAQCDALAAAPGVIASGATRPGSDLRAAVAPNRNIETLEASPGFERLLADQPQSRVLATSGVWADNALLDGLGLAPGSTEVPLVGSGSVTIAGRYANPEDGRIRALERRLVIPVAPQGRFDQCWVMSWPSEDHAQAVLSTVLLSVDGGVDSGSTPVESTRFNATYGTQFPDRESFEKLPLRAATGAAGLLGLVVGYLAVRMRRLELASALHAGVPKSALCLTIFVEVALWLTASLAILGALTVIMSMRLAPDDRLALANPAIHSAVLAAMMTFVGSFIATVLTRERRLFAYFKQR